MGKELYIGGGADWDDEAPSAEYFTELFRVSKNQIIWGGNYFVQHLRPTQGWIFWDKGTGANNFSDGELAWTSFNRALRMYRQSWVGSNAKESTEKDRIHPTQKPVMLYKWLLAKYADEDAKILDTHVGSASSLIACYDMGFDYVGFEIDEEYYKLATKRLEEEMAQVRWKW